MIEPGAFTPARFFFSLLPVAPAVGCPQDTPPEQALRPNAVRQAGTARPGRTVPVLLRRQMTKVPQPVSVAAKRAGRGQKRAGSRPRADASLPSPLPTIGTGRVARPGNPAGRTPSPPSAQSKVLVHSATVLFTDLRGFTGLAQRLAENPAELFAVLNAHLEVVVNAVRRSGGVVEKFTGDGVLATFDARADQRDHRRRAVAAARAVVGGNDALNRRRASQWGFRLEVGVGIATGKVVVGRVGPLGRSAVEVLGDPVNVAARLVRRARPGEVLLEASACEGLTNKVQVELVGRSAVRGRRGKLKVYCLGLPDKRR